MKTQRSAITLLGCLLISSFVAGCSTSDPSDELGEETAADGEDGKGDAAGLFTYYSVVPDLRQCSLDAGPDCGLGFFASRVNRSITPCGPGVAVAQCKVRALDWSATGLSTASLEAYEAKLREGTQLVLRGTIAPSGSGTGLTLAVTELWTGSSEAWADADAGVFTMVKGNGLACIESPCPDKTERRLNSNIAGANIAWIDFEASGATDDLIDAATDAIDADGAIVVGRRFYGEGAKGRSANAFFLRATE